MQQPLRLKKVQYLGIKHCKTQQLALYSRVS